MSPSTKKSVLAMLAVASSAEAFTMHNNNNNAIRSPLNLVSQQKSILQMASSAEEEVAALRAAAQRARDDAMRLAKELGKEEMALPTATATAPKEIPALSSAEIDDLIKPINFEGDDASTQTSKLDSMSDKLGLWKAATTSSANTNSPSPLRPYPVSLNFLETRTGGKITAKSLGVGNEDDVSLDDFKYATLYVTLGASVAGVAALALLPENIGATVCYLVALIPILWLAIGSSAPAFIAGAIAAARGTSEEQSVQEDRVCRHEAGHFLCGYLCGLPVRSYQANDMGYPCVEFYPATDGEAMGRELSDEEVAILSVVAMSGSVAEALEFGEAKGGDNDLIELNRLYTKSAVFMGSQKQQDMTRWGALAAYNMITFNKEKYENLVEAFRAKKTVAQCIAAIEASS